LNCTIIKEANGATQLNCQNL